MTKPTKLKDMFHITRKNGVFSIEPLSDDECRALNISPEISRSIAEAISRFIGNLPDDDFQFTPKHKPATANTSATAEEDEGAGCDCDPETLPMVIETLPEVSGHRTLLWQRIENLPGYAVSGIRRMGRDIFMSFPCFQKFAEDCKADGADPLGKVMIASDLTHNQSVTNALADMISKKGAFANAGVMDHLDAIPGYKPRIAVFMTDEWTFKLVQDRPEYGAPISANYIYAWPGGLKAYQTPAIEQEPETAPELPRLIPKS